MQRVRVLGIVLFVLGLWVFLAPFIGPVMHLYFSPPTMMGMQHMGGVGGMSSSVVVVNPAMVFFNFIPGMVLILIGVYHIFSGQTSRFTP